MTSTSVPPISPIKSGWCGPSRLEAETGQVRRTGSAPDQFRRTGRGVAGDSGLALRAPAAAIGRADEPPHASTYRVQWGESFGFAELAEAVPFLSGLGVETLYVPPLFEAGALHGYNVSDPTRLSSALGGQEAFDELAGALAQHGMKLLIDFPPNHLLAGTANPWWRDVLECGQSSPVAHFFDIDWGSKDKLVFPILGQPLHEVLADDNLMTTQPLRLEEQGFVFNYWEHAVPIDLRSVTDLLDPDRPFPGAAAPELSEAARDRLGQLRAEIHRLPPAGKKESSDQTAAREGIKRALWDLYQGRAPGVTGFREFVDSRMAVLNQAVATSAPPGQLEKLLLAQSYDLAYWKTAEVNYRRFFDINELVGVCVEKPDVREATHAGLLGLYERYPNVIVAGVRVDHIDGLRDPKAYLDWLGSRCLTYRVPEKILAPDEALPPDWQAQGTTGYDFLNLVNGLSVDPAGLEALGDVYEAMVPKGDIGPVNEVVYCLKRRILRETFGAEVKRLSIKLAHLARGDSEAKHIPVERLRNALTAVMAALPHYRTYVGADGVMSDGDRRTVEAALETAADWGRPRTAAVQFVKRALLLDTDNPALRRAFVDFVRDLQQYSGAAMAKALEDTAMYRMNRLVSLNEVGGEMDVHEDPVAAFHKSCRKTAADHPLTMTTTSTHDTKRSEDVRSRLNTLSELAGEWKEHVAFWDEPFRDGRIETPVSANDRYLFYQTLLGVWPAGGDVDLEGLQTRIQQYMAKAAREAKVETTWVHVNDEYERSLADMVAGFFTRLDRDEALREDFLAFHAKVSRGGAVNSLAQVAIKTASPGLPDYYRGTEVWDFSLVDPDNRRPIDYDHLAQLLYHLDRVGGPSPEDVFAEPRSDLCKLHVTRQSLRLRDRHRDALTRGRYLGLSAAGPRKDNVVAFARQYGDDWVLCITPRLVTGALAGNSQLDASFWGGSGVVLPPNAPIAWRNTLTGEVVDAVVDDESGQAFLPIAGACGAAPIALLEPVGGAKTISPILRTRAVNTRSASKELELAADRIGQASQADSNRTETGRWRYDTEAQSLVPVAVVPGAPVDWKSLPLGCTNLGDGRTAFLLWAPKAGDVAIEIDGRRHQAEGVADGYHGVVVEGVEPGTRYKIALDQNEAAFPDPFSHYQPEGVHGPSEVIDHEAFEWTDGTWNGLDPSNLVIQPAHVGTFTREGTFAGLAGKIAEQKADGFDAVQLLPISQFPGKRNWGYDPAVFTAPHNTYGRPDDLKALVNSYHAAGMGVIVDVVFNHPGPEGAYLNAFGPYFDGDETPWGRGVKQDADVVRFFAETAAFWATQYHIDGFRFDATHALPASVKREINAALRQLSVKLGRSIYLVAEDNQNDRKVVLPRKEGGLDYDAQYCDEFCHSLRMHLNPREKTAGYLKDFAEQPFQQMLKALARGGWVYEGERSEFEGRPRGTPGGDLPGEASIIIKNSHDQTGNTADGMRPDAGISAEHKKLEHALMLLSPFNVSVFQGDQWGSEQPFYYFVDHGDSGLREAVVAGRNREFAYFLQPGETMPDPTAASTFNASVLDHSEADAGAYRDLRALWRQLAHLRKTHPALEHLSKDHTQVVELDPRGAFSLHRWGGGKEVLALFNSANEPIAIDLYQGDVVGRDGRSSTPRKPFAGVWTKLLDTSDAKWGGKGTRGGRCDLAGHSQMTLQPGEVLVLERDAPQEHRFDGPLLTKRTAMRDQPRRQEPTFPALRARL